MVSAFEDSVTVSYYNNVYYFGRGLLKIIRKRLLKCTDLRLNDICKKNNCTAILIIMIIIWVLIHLILEIGSLFLLDNQPFKAGS